MTLHVARLYLTQIATDSIEDIMRDVEAHTRKMASASASASASANVDVLVLGATAPSFLKKLGL